MKKNFVKILLAISLFSSVGHTFGQLGFDELKTNFYSCIKSDASWYQRWGYWVASFSQDEAWKICRYYGAGTRMTGCEINEQWLKAGYVCWWD